MRIIILAFLNLLIILLVIVCIFLGYRFFVAFQQNQSLVAALFDNRELLERIHILKPESWKTYNAPSFTFEYPPKWSPRQREILGGESEAIDLKIPIFLSLSRLGANNLIGYSRDDLFRRRPANDLISEQDFVMGNRKATKWIYRKDGSVHYEYIISMQRYSLNGKNVSSFYLHAESSSQDSEFEAELDRVASSVKFKADETL